MTLTLAHLSDIHLGPLPPFSVRHWNLKRGLGFLNWHRNRRHAHLPAMLDALVSDLHGQRPDHIAVTGDLINIGLPNEYESALSWLKTVGGPERVTVIPGNHDIYVRLRNDPGVRRWRPYMSSLNALGLEPESGRGAGPELEFPFIRRLGRIALIGLNSAVPTPPFVAAGRIGREQLSRLAETLRSLGREGLIRVVLIHHPPLPGQASRMKALRDADTLAEVLSSCGAELVLHGHNHREQIEHHPTLWGGVPIIGVPSASLGVPHKGETLARYHLFRFETSESEQSITHVSRGVTAPGGAVVEISRRVLPIARRIPGTHAPEPQSG